MPTGTGHNISIEIVDSSLKRLNQLQVDFVTQWQKHFFGSLPMTAKYSWAGANETRFNVFIYKEDEIVSRLRIISRKARVDSAGIQVGGIGGVITAPAHQRKGFATLALREAERLIFQVLNARLGVLLCLPELVSFYQRFGWRGIECPVTFEQPDGMVVWSESAMFLPEAGENWIPRTFDLCGLPF